MLSCLLPARLGFGSHQKTDPRTQEKPRLGLGDPEFDPFRGNPLPLYRATDQPRTRANTAPSSSQPPPLLIPDGGIGESPNPVHRSLGPPARPKRSSFTTFFAFSSKRRSTHDLLAPSHSVPGRWVPGSGQTQVQLINTASVPSPLRTDEEEYYYSYYASLTPTVPASSQPDPTNSSQQQDLIGNPDLDSQFSSPVDSPPSHTHIRHPYSYSTPLYSKPYPNTIDTAPPLRHATSQPLRHHPLISPSGVHAGSRPPTSHLGHRAPHLLQSELKTSMSTPNLVTGAASVRPRSLLRKKPTRSKGERWLSAETWWDALFSPSPRFKVKQAPRPDPATGTIVNNHAGNPIQHEPNRNLSVTFPSVPAVRPRAVSATSATSNTKPTYPTISRSRSAADLSGQPSTSATQRAAFEPALETLVDQPTPPPDQRSASDTEFPLPDPPLSLEQ